MESPQQQQQQELPSFFQTPLVPPVVVFPEQLHYVLAKLALDGQADIASWNPHGRCFAVHSRAKFVEKVLPVWFRQTKYTSFQRQLSMYGFTCIPCGPDMGAYYHADFLRGQPALARSIKRMPIKGLASSTRRPLITAATTPNFYAMRPLPPIDADASSNAESRVLHSFVQHYGLHVMQQHWLQRHASQALMETRQRLGASSPVSTQPSLKVTCPLIVDTATVGESKSSPQSQREAHIQENRDEHNGIVIVPWPSPTQKAVGCTLGY